MFVTKEYQRARLIWSQGNPIPVDLYIALSEQGIDVDRLQNKYLK